MKSIYLLSFILVLASAKLAIDFSNLSIPPPTFYDCLVNQNATRVVYEISDEQGNINENFIPNYIRAKDAGIKEVDAFVRLNDSLKAEDLLFHVNTALPASFDGTVWLDVQYKSKLWSLKPAQRKAYVENVARIAQGYNFNIGISSAAESWAIVMGGLRVGSDFLSSSFPVWYANNNGEDDFLDFPSIGFGTWKTPDMKRYRLNAYICNYYIVGLSFYP